MELKARFKVIMSSEADAFLDTLRQDIKDKIVYNVDKVANGYICLLYTSPSPRDRSVSRMPSSA